MDSEPASGLVSGSDLPAALFLRPSGGKQRGDGQYIYAAATQHARVGLEATLPERNTHAERR